MCVPSVPGAAGADLLTGGKGLKKATGAIQDAMFPSISTPAQTRQDLQQVEEISPQQRRSRSLIGS